MNRPATKLAALVVAVLTASSGLVALTLPDNRPLPIHPDVWSVAGETPLAYVPPKPFPPKGKAFLGLQTNLGPYDFSAVDRGESRAAWTMPSLRPTGEGLVVAAQRVATVASVHPAPRPGGAGRLERGHR